MRRKVEDAPGFFFSFLPNTQFGTLYKVFPLSFGTLRMRSIEYYFHPSLCELCSIDLHSLVLSQGSDKGSSHKLFHHSLDAVVCFQKVLALA